MPIACRVGCTRIIEPLNPLYEKELITVGNGIAEVWPNVSFNIKVANICSAPVWVARNEKLAFARPAPFKVLEDELRETEG